MPPQELPHAVVVVHVHDDPDALLRTWPTVIGQRWDGPLRVIAVDDRASDPARAALRELVARSPTATTVHRDVRGGRAVARAEALEQLADDDLVAFADPGDVWHPRKLALQHQALARAAEDDLPRLATCSHRLVDVRDQSVEVVDPDLGDGLAERLATRTLELPGGTLAATAAALRTIGGLDVRLRHRDDQDLLLRLLAHGGHVVVPGDGPPLLTGPKVRDHPGPHDLLDAERRIRRAHRITIRAAGDAGRRAHVRELERAARRFERAGAALPARVWRTRARGARAVGRLVRLARPEPGGGPIADRRASPADHRPDASAPAVAEAEPPSLPAGVAASVARATDAAQAQSWDEVVDAWRELDDRSHLLPAALYERVARAFRALGCHTDAVAVAESGLRAWPHSERIRVELAKSRAAITDWTAAIRSDDEPPAAGSSRTRTSSPGRVWSLGLLGGGDGPVRGVVAHHDAAYPPAVTLRVDGTPVATSHAAVAGDGIPTGHRGFALRCDQLLEFLGDGDELTVDTTAGRLTLPDGGTRGTVMTGYPSRMDGLRARLADGRVFTKFGQLRPGYTVSHERRTLDLADEVSDVVEELHGYRCTPFYGNLLGAVRDAGFIAHDVGGFDLGYVSREHDARAVRAEFVALCRRLLDQGLHLELEPFGAMVRRRPGDRIFVDCNYGWFTPAGALQLSYGWRHDPVVGPDRLAPTRQTYLAGRLVTVPIDAEAVLQQVYGADWWIPDQGFDLAHLLRRDDRFLLDAHDHADLSAAAPDQVQVLGDAGR